MITIVATMCVIVTFVPLAGMMPMPVSAPASAYVSVPSTGPQTPVPSAPAPKGTDSLLPGGATSIQETHGDWLVRCVQREARKLCSLSQQLMDKENRRVAALELAPASPGGAEGILLLPFGLAVDKQITLEASATVLSALHFRTCLQAGCVVDLKFDTRTLERLNKEETLTVKMTADGGQPFSFNLSLKGFQGALDRTTALLK